ncbi:IS1634 family transposase, partial [Desulfobotulus mexicanus]
EDIRQSTVREYGAFYLLHQIADKIGLLEALQKSNAEHWQELFVLACYLVTSGDPFLYCEQWVQNTECLPVGSMSSQRISELMGVISADQQNQFYQLWCKLRSEKEYLALDITSISSYSNLIDDVEWGYNRDHESLPQVNLCLLMGENSHLPIYQEFYSGSLKDVSTLKTTLSKLAIFTQNRPLRLVMDKGFYSIQNVNSMLEQADLRWLIAVPFTTGIAKKSVDSERKDIDRVTNTIVIGSDSIRAVTKEQAWNPEHRIYVHVYYNALKGAKIREDLYSYTARLRDFAKENPVMASGDAQYRKYLIIRRSTKQSSGYTVSIREDAVEKALGYAGWMVLISNDVSEATEALRIYRDKDVVEKGFDRMKNNLDLGRLRVHSNHNARNKTFVGFLALILLSKIHYTMLQEKLYCKMTMKELLLTLSKLRRQEIKGTKILFPLSRLQMTIFKAFGVKEPA